MHSVETHSFNCSVSVYCLYKELQYAMFLNIFTYVVSLPIFFFISK